MINIDVWYLFGPNGGSVSKINCLQLTAGKERARMSEELKKHDFLLF